METIASAAMPSSCAESTDSLPPASRDRARHLSANTVLMVQVFCVLMALLPIVCYTIWTESVFWRDNQIAGVQRLVQGLSSRQTTLAASTESLLMSMSLAPVVQSGNAEGAYEFLSRVDRDQPEFEGFALFDTAGETLAGLFDGKPRDRPAELVRSREYFMSALSSKGFHISSALLLENGSTILPMTMPVIDGNGVATGLLMASLSITRHKAVMNGLVSGDTVGVFLFDAAFKPIFAYSPPNDNGRSVALLRSLSLPDFLPRTAARFVEDTAPHANVFWLDDPEAKSRFVGSCTALRVGNSPDATPYLYILAMTEELSGGKLLSERYLLPLLATILAVFGVLLVARWLGQRYFARGLQQLCRVAEHIREDDLAVRCGTVSGCKEITTLSTTFDLMLDVLEQKNAQLRKLSSTDPLTGLWNRRHFTSVANLELSLAAREKRNVTVVMADIDHFKKVNDTYGHAVGDMVLQQFATLLRDTARTSDIVARYGGEEFILFLPSTEATGALVLVEKLRCGVESMRVQLPSGELLSITASFGVASQVPERGTTEILLLEALQRRADEALYASKLNGRNKVTAG